MTGKPIRAEKDTGLEEAQIESSDAAPGDMANIKALAEQNTAAEHGMSFRQAIRLYPRSVFFCLVFSMSIIMEGYQVGLVPSLFAQPAFRRKYGERRRNGSHELDSVWQSALTAATQVGSIMGYWISGIAIERFGYKKTMQGALLSITCFIFIIFFAPNVVTLVVGEGLIGVPWGIIQTLTTTYAAEVSPVALRAYVTSYSNLCWVIGGFISTGILRGTVSRLDQWAYRIPFAIQWIWPVPIMVGVYFAPESPWWLVRKGRIDDARTALLSLTSTRHSGHDVENVIAMITHTIDQERQIDQGVHYRDCFTGIHLRRTEIACIAGAVPFLAGFGFNSQAIYFLSVAGLHPDTAYNVGLGQGALAFVGVWASWMLMHRFGRRTLYLWGFSAVSILLLLIGILAVIPVKSRAPIWAIGGLMMFYTFIYTSCLGPVAYAIVSETPSSRLRNKTVALARIFLNLLNFAASWLNPAIINPTAWNLGGKGGYIWCGVSCTALIWTFLRFPEMKGRTFGEIDDLFHQKISAKDFAQASARVAAERTD